MARAIRGCRARTREAPNLHWHSPTSRPREGDPGYGLGNVAMRVAAIATLPGRPRVPRAGGAGDPPPCGSCPSSSHFRTPTSRQVQLLPRVDKLSGVQSFLLEGPRCQRWSAAVGPLLSRRTHHDSREDCRLMTYHAAIHTIDNCSHRPRSKQMLRPVWNDLTYVRPRSILRGFFKHPHPYDRTTSPPRGLHQSLPLFRSVIWASLSLGSCRTLLNREMPV